MLAIMLCLAVIPHKYCYAPVQKIETATEVVIYLQRNTFFSDCDRDTRIVVNTDKDVTVYKDGAKYRTYTNSELCDGQ